MKKGKRIKVYGVSIYREFENKPVEERGIRVRPAVFRSVKEYDRNKFKKELRRMESF